MKTLTESQLIQEMFESDRPVVNELFDTTAWIDWQVRTKQLWEAKFEIDDVPFEFSAERNSDTGDWDVEFAIDMFYKDGKRVNRYGSTGLSGTSSVKVFGVVVNLMHMWLRNIKPNKFSFVGDTSNGREKLYKIMVTKLSPKLKQLGYSNNVHHDPAHGRLGQPASVFTFTKETATDITETSTAGGTSASAVATAVGGLGAGFDPNGDHGIYQDRRKRRKPLMLRR